MEVLPKTGCIEGKDIYEREMELSQYLGPDRVVSSNDFLEIEKGKPAAELHLKTGIPRLDQKTDGVVGGELIVVSGPTGHGKTTLCDTIGRNITRNGVNVLWFSFELQPKQFLAKYQNGPIIYVPLERRPGSLSWLADRVWESVLKHNTKVVFIDHLHFVVDIAKMRNPSMEIGAAMRFIKTDIALRHGVVVFLISHVTKLKFDEEVSENDLRDSSFIAQEADGVWMIYRRPEIGKKPTDEDAYANKARIVVCKSRRSGVMKARVNVMKVFDDIVEEDMEFKEENPF